MCTDILLRWSCTAMEIEEMLLNDTAERCDLVRQMSGFLCCDKAVIDGNLVGNNIGFTHGFGNLISACSNLSWAE